MYFPFLHLKIQKYFTVLFALNYESVIYVRYYNLTRYKIQYLWLVLFWKLLYSIKIHVQDTRQSDCSSEPNT